MARRRTPAANAWRTSSSGTSSPSDRVVWVCRSIVDGPGGTTRSGSARGMGSCRPGFPPVATSGLDEALDPLDGERAPGRRVDVHLDRVEDDGSFADLESGRERVDEAWQHRLWIEADDAP